jgi:hypothetical protein
MKLKRLISVDVELTPDELSRLVDQCDDVIVLTRIIFVALSRITAEDIKRLKEFTPREERVLLLAKWKADLNNARLGEVKATPRPGHPDD